ncbi:hypothetical protein FOZ60_013555, partial [Perkinsus olseni]
FAKQRLTSEFLDAEPVKDIVGRAVDPHPVERFVEVAGRISYTVDHTTNPDCLPDSGTAVIYSGGSVLPESRNPRDMVSGVDWVNADACWKSRRYLGLHESH